MVLEVGRLDHDFDRARLHRRRIFAVALSRPNADNVGMREASTGTAEFASDSDIPCTTVARAVTGQALVLVHLRAEGVGN